MIETTNLSYRIGDFHLRDISLKIGEGEYFVLLGKPGSGKSILLECICGLRRVSAGTIRIGGKDVTYAEPRDRCVGYVPQDYALFPTKRVRDNIIFGLRVRGISHNEIEDRIDNIAGLLNIKYLLDRMIPGLSGGEQQKVALARALIIQPKVLLLDEPVSALDEATRETVCMELKHIQRETGTTTVHVSHNFEETRIVADRVGILNNGRLVQVGTPDEVFNRPADADIASFLRAGNILRGSTEGECTNITVGDGISIRSKIVFESPREVEFVLSVKDISVSLELPDNGLENTLTGKVVGFFPRGIISYIAVELAPGLTLTAPAPASLNTIAYGAVVYLSFPASAIYILGF